MARGGTSTGNCNKSEKFLHGLTSHSCFNIIVVICCMFTSLFMVQLILTRALGNCNNTATFDSLTSSATELSLSQQQPPSSKTSETSTSPSTQSLPETDEIYDDTLGLGQETSRANVSRIVFGIAGAAKNWPKRKQYVKLWWNSHKTRLRGFVWLDKEVEGEIWDADAPPFRVSEDTRGFEYKHRGGNRAAIRISRVVKEMVRLGLPDVDWFVMGDDDTFFFPQNVADALSKYDPSKMFYVGMPSESHSQNLLYSYGMAFGGGGFAISSAAAKAISTMLDPCIARFVCEFFPTNCLESSTNGILQPFICIQVHGCRSRIELLHHLLEFFGRFF